MNNESIEFLRIKFYICIICVFNYVNNELNDKIIDQICYCLKCFEMIFIYGFGVFFVVVIDLY